MGKQRSFAFEQNLMVLVLVAIVTNFEIKRNSFCLLLIACKISNKSNKRQLRYCNVMFSLSYRIASVRSYLSENEAKNLPGGPSPR